MKLRVIRTREMEICSKLDPYGILERAFLPGYICVGLFLNDEDATPSGVLLFAEALGKFYLEWLYVAPESRGLGLGEALLAGLYKIALYKGYKDIYAVIPYYGTRERLCPYDKAYLLDRFFDKEIAVAPEWNGRLMPVVRRPVFQESVINGDKWGESKGYEIKSFSMLTTAERLSVLEEIEKSPGAELLHSLKSVSRSFARDLSLCTFKKDKLTGAVILEYAGDGIYMTGFMAVVEEQVVWLLTRALQEAAKEKPNSTIHINLRHNDYAEAFTTILGEGQPSFTLSCKTLNYVVDMELPEEIPEFLDALIAGLEEEDDETGDDE